MPIDLQYATTDEDLQELAKCAEAYGLVVMAEDLTDRLDAWAKTLAALPDLAHVVPSSGRIDPVDLRRACVPLARAAAEASFIANLVEDLLDGAVPAAAELLAATQSHQREPVAQRVRLAFLVVAARGQMAVEEVGHE